MARHIMSVNLPIIVPWTHLLSIRDLRKVMQAMIEGCKVMSLSTDQFIPDVPRTVWPERFHLIYRGDVPSQNVIKSLIQQQILKARKGIPLTTP